MLYLKILLVIVVIVDGDSLVLCVVVYSELVIFLLVIMCWVEDLCLIIFLVIWLFFNDSLMWLLVLWLKWIVCRLLDRGRLKVIFVLGCSLVRVCCVLGCFSIWCIIVVGMLVLLNRLLRVWLCCMCSICQLLFGVCRWCFCESGGNGRVSVVWFLEQGDLMVCEKFGMMVVISVLMVVKRLVCIQWWWVQCWLKVVGRCCLSF